VTTRSSAADERRRVVAAAGHTGDEGTARNGLNDPIPAVRAIALGALQRMGRLHDNDLDIALADLDPAVRRRAAELAAGARVDLHPVLGDPDPYVAEAAAWSIGEQGRTEDEALEALARMARDHEDALCREAAVAALGAVGDTRGLPAILAAMNDKPAVRRRAVIALAPFDGPEVDSALQRALQDRDWQVRQAAEDQLAP
jgi:HEAT repeat protein